jgi:hypothetical protein
MGSDVQNSQLTEESFSIAECFPPSIVNSVRLSLTRAMTSTDLIRLAHTRGAVGARVRLAARRSSEARAGVMCPASTIIGGGSHSRACLRSPACG